MTGQPDKNFIADQLKRMMGEVPECIHELFKRMPFGQPVELPSGRTGHFAVFYEPKKREGWCFGVDFKFTDGGSPDHFEFIVEHTGGGGAPSVPKHDEPIS